MNIGVHTFAMKNQGTHNHPKGQFKLKPIDAYIDNKDVIQTN
jgi:hypothetical protein